MVCVFGKLDSLLWTGTSNECGLQGKTGALSLKILFKQRNTFFLYYYNLALYTQTRA